MSDTAVANVQPGQDLDETEQQVLSALAYLETLPPEVQAAVCARLLRGFASKLTSSIATKAITGAKAEGLPTLPKPKNRARGVGSSQDYDVPRAHSRLRQLEDPTDPMEAWQKFGQSAVDVLEILREEPTGVLEAMLRHPNMPPGPKVRAKSRDKIAEAIALRLEQHFRVR